MRTGNYQVKGGKVHLFIEQQIAYGLMYTCGICANIESVINRDAPTTKPVTCRNCLRVVASKEKK